MGSKINRWKVKKSKWFKNSMVGAPLVYTGGWHVETKHGERISFPTWREAMDYADRMARTITVTLPRTSPSTPPPTGQPSVGWGRSSYTPRKHAASATAT